MRWRQILLPWLPMVLLLAIVGIYLVVYNVLTVCVMPASHCVAESTLRPAVDALLANTGATDPSTGFLVLAARLKWVASVGFSILLSLLAVGIAAVAIHAAARFHVPGAATPLVTTSLVVLSAMVYAGLRATAGMEQHPWRQLLTKKLLAQVPQAATWTPQLDRAGLLAALYLAFAATVVTRVALVQTRFSDRHETCAFWLRAILCVGAALLIVTVLRAHVLFALSLAYWPRSSTSAVAQLEHVRSAARELGASITAVEGIFFSAILAAIYLPAAFLVHTSGVRLLDASHEVTESGRIRWEEQVPLRKVLPRIVAILSPLATGWLATALEALRQ